MGSLHGAELIATISPSRRGRKVLRFFIGEAARGAPRGERMRRRQFITLIGVAAALPLAARAQQPAKSYRISYLALLPSEDTTLAKPLSQRLRELGYSEGKNMTFEYRSAEGRAERLNQLAADLVSANPDVLIAGFGALTVNAAMAATKTIPIVFTSVADPVGTGFVASLAHPGANVTGVTSQSTDIATKRLQILEDFVPGKQLVAVLMNPDTPFTALALQEVKTAAAARHQPLALFEARTVDQVPAGIEAAIKTGAAALLTLDDPLLLGAKQQVADLAAKARLPAIYGTRDFVDAGGLMSYGVDRRQLSRRAAEYVDRILKGALPADLPVERPTKFEFVINLKTAKALGLEIPPTLLATADEVIE
jgi:putative tryptophan/tyrosine transport system substrate-binding protein